MLFSGTLRSNLDPWSRHGDAELWEVLAAVKLKAHIEAAGGLHTRMAEAGDNLSVGQRQLFCLARYAVVVAGVGFYFVRGHVAVGVIMSDLGISAL